MRRHPGRHGASDRAAGGTRPLGAAEFPVASNGRYFEDYLPGSVYEYGHVNVTKDEIRVTAVFGAAILDEDGQMVGSMLVMSAGSRAYLDARLRVEPYVVDDVWATVEVRRCEIEPSFLASTAPPDRSPDPAG